MLQHVRLIALNLELQRAEGQDPASRANSAEPVREGVNLLAFPVDGTDVEIVAATIDRQSFSSYLLRCSQNARTLRVRTAFVSERNGAGIVTQQRCIYAVSQFRR